MLPLPSHQPKLTTQLAGHLSVWPCISGPSFPGTGRKGIGFPDSSAQMGHEISLTQLCVDIKLCTFWRACSHSLFLLHRKPLSPAQLEKVSITSFIYECIGRSGLGGIAPRAQGSRSHMPTLSLHHTPASPAALNPACYCLYRYLAQHFSSQRIRSTLLDKKVRARKGNLKLKQRSSFCLFL